MEQAARYQILNSCDVEKGWVEYDVKHEIEFLSERRVVVGRAALESR